MKVSVLASGSRGNCTYIEAGQTRILIDIGPRCLYIEQQLASISVLPQEIDAILITHTHRDHVDGLRVFSKRYHPKIYLTTMMYQPLKEYIQIDDCVFVDQPFLLNDIHVDILKISHDAEDTNGYIVKYQDTSVVYITDTGYIHQKLHDKLQNHNMYIMESNHDIELLMNGPYPYYLKQRIISDSGHLSNQASADYLTAFIGPRTHHVVLAHLSEHNNDPVIALSTLQQTLERTGKMIDHIIIAEQNERTEVFEL